MMSDDKNTLAGRMVAASQHPEYCTRKAEDFGTVLFAMLGDFAAGNITAESFGASYRKFCIDQLREILDHSNKGSLLHAADEYYAQRDEARAEADGIRRELQAEFCYCDPANVMSSSMVCRGCKKRVNFAVRKILLKPIPDWIKEVKARENEAIAALRKIDEPLKYHHWEEDPYTRAGCFQFVAHEARIELGDTERTPDKPVTK